MWMVDKAYQRVARRHGLDAVKDRDFLIIDHSHEVVEEIDRISFEGFAWMIVGFAVVIIGLSCFAVPS